jgi:hypothetical protein
VKSEKKEKMRKVSNAQKLKGGIVGIVSAAALRSRA